MLEKLGATRAGSKGSGVPEREIGRRSACRLVVSAVTRAWGPVSGGLGTDNCRRRRRPARCRAIATCGSASCALLSTARASQRPPTEPGPVVPPRYPPHLAPPRQGASWPRSGARSPTCLAKSRGWAADQGRFTLSPPPGATPGTTSGKTSGPKAPRPGLRHVAAGGGQHEGRGEPCPLPGRRASPPSLDLPSYPLDAPRVDSAKPQGSVVLPTATLGEDGPGQKPERAHVAHSGAGTRVLSASRLVSPSRRR